MVEKITGPKLEFTTDILLCVQIIKLPLNGSVHTNSLVLLYPLIQTLILMGNGHLTDS